MKTSVILSAILFSGLVYNTAKAQVSIHVGFNTPVRRIYVPAPQPVETVYDDDFDNSDDYYYLPEVEAYYSIPLNRYFYYDNDSRWVSAAYLPGAYRNYNWRTARRFEVRGRRPYMNHDVYRNRWGGSNNRDWNRGNNNYADRNNNRYDNRNDGYRGNWSGNQPSRNNGYNQPNRDVNRERDNWDRQSQPSRDDNRGRGNWGGDRSQPSQPSQNQNGNGRDRGQSQPSNNNERSRDRGNNDGGSQFAQTQNPRQSGFARPRF
jgi:hypothetical protein